MSNDIGGLGQMNYILSVKCLRVSVIKFFRNRNGRLLFSVTSYLFRRMAKNMSVNRLVYDDLFEQIANECPPNIGCKLMVNSLITTPVDYVIL